MLAQQHAEVMAHAEQMLPRQLLPVPCRRLGWHALSARQWLGCDHSVAAACIDTRFGLAMDSPHGDVAVLTLAECDD